MMTRFIPGLYSFLIAFSAFADEVKDAPIPEKADVVGITIFLVLFVGSCVGFFAYMWWRHKHNKED